MENDAKKRLVTAFLGKDPYFPETEIARRRETTSAKPIHERAAIYWTRWSADIDTARLPQRFLKKAEAGVEAPKTWMEIRGTCSISDEA